MCGNKPCTARCVTPSNELLSSEIPLEDHTPGQVRKLGYRNAELAGFTDEASPNPDNKSTYGRPTYQPTREEMNDFFSAMQARYSRMMSDKVFDYSHPVDEYGPPGNPGPVQSFIIQPDYDMPEKIEHINFVIPAGTTLFSVQLGQRTIVLYAGAALVTPVASFLPIGCILNSDDNRVVTATGATGQPYVGLSGFALTRGQFS